MGAHYKGESESADDAELNTTAAPLGELLALVTDRQRRLVAKVTPTWATLPGNSC